MAVENIPEFRGGLGRIWLRPGARAGVWVAAILGASTLLLFSSPMQEKQAEQKQAEQKQVSIYSTAANYSLPVSDRGGREYVGLLEALDPLGSVSATAAGARWRLRYNDVEAEFTNASSRARVHGATVDLSANFVLESGRGLVPLSSLATLMSHILGGPVSLHEASRRVFVGSVGVHFTAQINKAAAPVLVMNFTAPVNPMIATEPGKLRMVFRHEPLVAPGSPSLTFDSATIPSAIYEEDNGAAKITISSAEPLFASFSNGNRTIMISAAKSAQPANQAPAVALGTTQSAGAVSPAQPAKTVPIPASLPPSKFFAVVDASHGGTERGAALSTQLAEKDVTLAFARLLRRELEAHGISTLILRDGDNTITLDQRASITNIVAPAIYICLHASADDQGVRLYTSLLPVGQGNSGPFLDWDTAQAAFLPLSQAAAASLGSELQRRSVPVRLLMAPLRPLNNIAAAAVAVEVAPPQEGIERLTSPAYEEQVAGGIAAGILLMRDRLGAQR